jgi:YD repeat-containing protein
LYLQQNGGSIPYGVNYYDTGGRVIFMANPNHHEHFAYDDKGRMIYWLDSANDGRRFEKHEYHFGYDDKGAVNMYKTSTTESKFALSGHELKEDVSKNGSVIERRIYSYNNDGKLTQEMHYELNKDSVGKLLFSHKIFYNKYGDLASEIIYNPLNDCKGDSTIIINTYDSKAKLIQKRKTMKTMKCGTPASITERKTETETISYTYNAAGQLTSEGMTSIDPTRSYRKDYEYDTHGIILKERGFDGKGKSTTDISYTYIYYPIKRK